MSDCRVCGEPVSTDESACSRCGAPVISGATESFSPVTAEDEAPSAVAQASAGPVLVVRKGPQSGERFYLERERLTVGRDPSSDIFLNDMTVSRSHAVLESSGGCVSVRDDGSLNGTYVNGVCVDQAVLSDGDILQVGTFQMVFFSGTAE